MSKVLTIPHDVVLKDPLTEETIKIEKKNGDEVVLEDVSLTFYQFIVGSPLREDVFSANAVTIMNAIELKDKIKESSPGDDVVIDDETYNMLLQSVKEPKNGFNPNVALQIGSFFKAILDAKDHSEE